MSLHLQQQICFLLSISNPCCFLPSAGEILFKIGLGLSMPSGMGLLNEFDEREFHVLEEKFEALQLSHKQLAGTTLLGLLLLWPAVAW